MTQKGFLWWIRHTPNCKLSQFLQMRVCILLKLTRSIPQIQEKCSFYCRWEKMDEERFRWEKKWDTLFAWFKSNYFHECCVLSSNFPKLPGYEINSRQFKRSIPVNIHETSSCIFIWQYLSIMLVIFILIDLPTFKYIVSKNVSNYYYVRIIIAIYLVLNI